MQILDNKCQAVTINGDLNDKDYVSNLSGNKTPVVPGIQGISLIAREIFAFDMFCFQKF